MKNSYLEVTFRRGRPLAAYLYLPRQPNDKSYRTKRAEPGLVIDFNDPTAETAAGQRQRSPDNRDRRVRT
jgi:hypothetical protein